MKIHCSIRDLAARIDEAWKRERQETMDTYNTCNICGGLDGLDAPSRLVKYSTPCECVKGIEESN
jgi:hypothetical protein